MKPEELKQLKPGDEIFIRARYKKTYADGDVSFLHSNTNVYDVEIEMESYTHPQNVILPSELQPAPKYDPCRLFKKGDIVKKRSVFGRKIYIDDCLYEVMSKESCNKISIKKLNSDETLVGMPSVFFELVTPVEELESYTLEEETAYIDDEACGMLHIYYNYNGGRDKVRTFYENGPESWNATKAAAEDECARLNAEHRKERE